MMCKHGRTSATSIAGKFLLWRFNIVRVALACMFQSFRLQPWLHEDTRAVHRKIALGYQQKLECMRFYFDLRLPKICIAYTDGIPLLYLYLIFGLVCFSIDALRNNSPIRLGLCQQCKLNLAIFCIICVCC